MVIEFETQQGEVDRENEVVFKVRAGDVWRINLEKENGPTPAKFGRMGKIRPCIVISGEKWNLISPKNRVWIIPLSTKEPFNSDMPFSSNLGITINQSTAYEKVIGYPCFNMMQTAHVSSFVGYNGELSSSKMNEVMNALSSKILDLNIINAMEKRILELEIKNKELTDNRTTVILKDEMVLKLEEKLEELRLCIDEKQKVIINLRNTIETLSKPDDIVIDNQPDKVVYSTGPDEPIESGFMSTAMYNALSKSLVEDKYDSVDTSKLIAASGIGDRKKLVVFNSGTSSQSKEIKVNTKVEALLKVPNDRKQLNPTVNRHIDRVLKPITTTKSNNNIIVAENIAISASTIVSKCINEKEMKMETQETTKKYVVGVSSKKATNWSKNQAKEFIEYIEDDHTIAETCKKFNIRSYATYSKITKIVKEILNKK